MSESQENQNPAVADSASEVPAETPVSTIETKTVEQANADYVGGTAQDQGTPPEEEQAAAALSTENAPAFQEPPAAADNTPIFLPVDPDGSKLFGLLHDVLRTLIPQQQNGVTYDLLAGVLKDETTTRALSVLLRRVLGHPDARVVSLKVLGDVLQGDEAAHFAARGLNEGQLLEFFHQVTPEAIRRLTPAVA